MKRALCDERVCVVTGAGRGLGRAYALELARLGARIVVNDLGVGPDGSGSNEGPAREVVDMIRIAGGEAVVSFENVADWVGAGRMIKTAIDTWGRLDVLVNSAGFVRDRMLVNASEEEWDAVVQVHLKGHFAPTRHAAAYFRDRSKTGEAVDARIINTTSGAGLLGSVGQGAYSAAKAGIAALTLVEAAELGRYGVTANAIAPAARTRMTETTLAEMMRKPEKGFDAMAPENVAPLVGWLASPQSKAVTGRVFEVSGGSIAIAEGWGPGVSVDKGARWDATEIGSAVADLLSRAAAPRKPYGA